MIAALATVVAAVIAAQMILIFRLQAQIAEMRRTWRPRNQGVLSPMPWPPAGEPEDIEVDEYVEEAVPA